MTEPKKVKRICRTCGKEVEAFNEPPDYPAGGHTKKRHGGSGEEVCTGAGKPTDHLPESEQQN